MILPLRLWLHFATLPVFSDEIIINIEAFRHCLKSSVIPTPRGTSLTNFSDHLGLVLNGWISQGGNYLACNMIWFLSVVLVALSVRVKSLHVRLLQQLHQNVLLASHTFPLRAVVNDRLPVYWLKNIFGLLHSCAFSVLAALVWLWACCILAGRLGLRIIIATRNHRKYIVDFWR